MKDFFNSSKYYLCLLILNSIALPEIPIKIFICKEHVDKTSLWCWFLIALMTVRWMNRYFELHSKERKRRG